MRREIEKFCVEIGKDPLLVQGAGGNISWKEGDTLWVKTSGTWMASAAQKNIFVPIDLSLLTKSVEDGSFTMPAKVATSSSRPSIETLLHAIMPQRVVVHLHAVEVLAYLVREECNLKDIVGKEFSYIVVDYHKPGACLARAIFEGIQENHRAEIVFMKNHGVTIGGPSIEAVQEKLKKLRELFGQALRPKISISPLEKKISLLGKTYFFIENSDIQQLAFDGLLFKRLSQDWALYPDHVVFLGEAAFIVTKDGDGAKDGPEHRPRAIFWEDRGVFSSVNFSKAESVQLLCYYLVLSRQGPEDRLRTLSKAQIKELLEWESEKYRQDVNESANSA